LVGRLGAIERSEMNPTFALEKRLSLCPASITGLDLEMIKQVIS